MKGSKSYKHVVLIPLSAIRSLVDISSSSLSLDESEQFGIVYSIDGQTRQLILRTINSHSSTNTSKSTFTDSMSSLSSISTLSSCTRSGNLKTDMLYHLAKAISDDRCLLDTVMISLISSCVLIAIESFQSSLIQTIDNHQMYCSQTSLEYSEIDSSSRSTSSLNLLGLALKRWGGG